MKKFLNLVFFISVFFISSCSIKNNSDILEVIFFDVGQGDSSFISYKNISILVDTGEEIYTDDVIKILKSKNIKHINYVILSHDHSDHASGFSKIYENFNIDNLILSDVFRDETFNDIENSLINLNTNVYYIKNPTTLNLLDNFNIKFLSSFDEEPKEFNDSSLVCKINVNDFDILYTGDIEEDAQINLLNKDIESEVLKVPHHGAYNNDKNNVENFLNKVNPLISVISVGKNSYGHPNKNTLSILENLNSKILRTDELGNILIRCNFKNNSLDIEWWK